MEEITSDRDRDKNQQNGENPVFYIHTKGCFGIKPRTVLKKRLSAFFPFQLAESPSNILPGLVGLRIAEHNFRGAEFD